MTDLMRFKIDQLTGSNYHSWKDDMQAMLMAKKLWRVVAAEVENTADETTQAIGLIYLHLSAAIRSSFRDYTSAHKLWQDIEQRYAQRSIVRRTTLKQQLHSVRMNHSETIDEYIARIRSIIIELRSTGYETQQSDEIDTVLNGLTESYEMTKIALTASNQELTFSAMEAALLDREQQLNIQSERDPDPDAAYWSRSRPHKGKQGITCYNCGGRGHIAADCRSSTNGESSNSSAGTHSSQQSQAYQRDNRSRGARHSYRHSGGRGRGGNRGGRHSGRADHNTVAFVTTGDKSSLSRADPERGVPWILDPACNNHICTDRSLFTDLNEDGYWGSVKTGGGSKVLIKGVGTAPVAVGGKTMVLHDTYYVPDFGCNLLSTNRATVVAPVRFLFRRGGCDILKQDPKRPKKWLQWLFVPTHQVEEMAILYSNWHGKDQVRAHLTKTPETPELWHLRYGHLGYDGLAKLMQCEMIVGMNVKPIDFSNKSKDACDACIMGKIHRLPFSANAHSADDVLELIHMDLCMMPTRSLGGSLYFATILDDYSGLAVVRPLKTKKEVKSFIIDTFTLLENQTQRTVKRVRTDNGREYVNQTLYAYYKHKGIHVETTVPYTPQQNGKAERFNRTLTERDRSMRYCANLPDHLWAESVMTATYLYNRSPRKGQNVTPYEAFYKRKPDVSNLKVFGSPAYAHIPRQHRNKLQAKAEKGVLVGYSTDKKAYRLYMANRIITSRDVAVDEHSMLSSRTDEIETESTTTVSKRDMIETNADVIDSDADDEHIISDRLQVTADVPGIPDVDGAGVLGSLDYSERPVRTPTVQNDLNTVPHGHYLRSTMKATQAFTTKAELHTESVSDAPKNFAEAMQSPDADKWMAAMQAELDSLVSHDVWTTTCPMPDDMRALPVKWVYKVKSDARGMPERYKARLVAKGYEQEYGINYSELFSPTSRHSTLRTYLAHVAQNKLYLHSMDVVTAFLQGALAEEVYIEPPPGFSFKDNVRAAKLNKALYGLKQAPRTFYQHMKRELGKIGFTASTADPSLFIKHTAEGTVLILTYVDDLLIAAESLSLITTVKHQLQSVFEIRDLGDTKEFLNMTVEYNREQGTLKLAQKAAIQKAVQKFGLANCRVKAVPMSTADIVIAHGEAISENIPYRSLVGSLLYFSVTTRPDIAFSVGVLSRHMSSPTTEHWKLAKNVLRYLSQTADLGLTFRSVHNSPILTGYSDADYAGDRDTRRSTTGYVFTYNGTAVSWNSKRQSSTAMSTMEAEYYAASLASKEAIWL